MNFCKIGQIGGFGAAPNVSSDFIISIHKLINYPFMNIFVDVSHSEVRFLDTGCSAMLLPFLFCVFLGLHGSYSKNVICVAVSLSIQIFKLSFILLLGTF